jgi:hypothetical protein
VSTFSNDLPPPTAQLGRINRLATSSEEPMFRDMASYFKPLGEMHQDNGSGLFENLPRANGSGVYGGDIQIKINKKKT